MDKAQLQALGGYVPPAPQKQTVVWSREGEDDVTFEVTVLPRTAGAMFRAKEMARELNGEADGASVAIAAFIRLGEDASESFTYEDAYNLDADLAAALLLAVARVQGVRTAKKASPPTTS